MDVLLEKKKNDKKSGKFRLTKAGITNETTGWWYFLRKYEDKEHPYWYKKKRLENKDGEAGEIVEEYVGLKLPFTVPAEWISKLKRRALK